MTWRVNVLAGPAAGSWEHRAAMLDMVGKLPRRDSHGASLMSTGSGGRMASSTNVAGTPPKGNA